MLQRIGKENLYFLLFGFLLLLTSSGCKPDTSTTSGEEEAYLADYEAPGDKWGFLNKTGEVIIEPRYDDVIPFSEGMATINQKGLWGYIDMKGKTIIEPHFKSAWAFHEHRARVQPFGMPAQFIDKSGKIVSSDQWSAEDDFSEGLARVKVGNTYGYIDTTGQLKIQPIYTRGWNFHKGLVMVEYNEKLGVINESGKNVVPFEFDHIRILQEGNLILCNIGESAKAFDFEGKEIARIENAKMIEGDSTYITVTQNQKMYFYNRLENKLQTTSSYLHILYLGEKRWALKKENGYQLADDNLHILSETEYKQINHFVNGIATYAKGKYWGYVNLAGEELSGDVFGLAWDYKDGLARAAFKEGVGFLDLNQKLAFFPPPGTVDIRDFSEGLAPIQLSR